MDKHEFVCEHVDTTSGFFNLSASKTLWSSRALDHTCTPFCMFSIGSSVISKAMSNHPNICNRRKGQRVCVCVLFLMVRPGRITLVSKIDS